MDPASVTQAIGANTTWN